MSDRKKKGTNVSESKADLVSIEMSNDGKKNFNGNAGATTTFTVGRWRTTEKLLMVVVGVLAAVLVAVIAVACSRESNASSPVCDTPGCIAAAHRLLQNIDESADPCQDFYRYACGGFEKRVRIPDDRSTRSQFAVIDDELELQLRDILEEERSQEAKAKESIVFRDQYQACMDLDTIESIGLKPLQNVLEKMGGWPVVDGDDWDEDAFSWEKTVYKFRNNGYSTDYLVDFSISTDIRNSTSRTIYFDEASLGMSREYLIKGLEDEDVGHYYSYMQKFAILLGADPERASRELKESLLFEIKLANASLPREERRNASKLYHPMRLDKVVDFAPIVNWTHYVNTLLTKEIMQVESSERVVVSSPGFLQNLTTLLNTEPPRNVANYMMWRAARATAGFLSKEAREITEEFTRNITGRTSNTPRWKKCVGSAAGSFSAAIGKMYVQRHFKEDSKKAMLEMVADIRQEFKHILDEITWMDDRTRGRAHHKLRTIKEYIAYPEEILDDAKLEDVYKGLYISNNTYFQNGQNMSIWSTNYHWRRLREKVDKTDWKRHADPAVVNAFYSSIENSIQFPAGILQGTFFSNDRPTYMNYGGIGWVIGHEITHGFDDQGRQYDAEGNLKDWWDAKTEKEFLSKTKCIIWQYGNYSADEVGLNLNGINTQGENIADNGGIKSAYRAYQKWVSRHGDERSLPGLSNLSPSQLFWLSAANSWCYKYRPKALEQAIQTGAHSPGMFRVRGPFSNSKDFARDFQCKSGTPMNPVNKCEVW